MLRRVDATDRHTIQNIFAQPVGRSRPFSGWRIWSIVPGRMTIHRFHSAVVVYLNLAKIFALSYGPDLAEAWALANLLPQRAAAGKSRTCRISFSKHGDIVPVGRFARSRPI